MDLVQFLSSTAFTNLIYLAILFVSWLVYKQATKIEDYLYSPKLSIPNSDFSYEIIEANQNIQATTRIQVINTNKQDVKIKSVSIELEKTKENKQKKLLYGTESISKEPRLNTMQGTYTFILNDKEFNADSFTLKLSIEYINHIGNARSECYKGLYQKTPTDNGESLLIKWVIQDG